ncbi:hypothetical protein K443DRAFT_293032 [Laccaria amethystina LaAM-08-1]|uniref:Uncharacterized protein n=1 Tax=Laccaria amethystina LaAM-08-1 TaxID=1095629 RepID=A0A0C9WKD9_9AGAR|nr:hypothetical protein K443DRAFT_293032 [Laccaria amethystina LaAM-08-1]
MIFIKFDIFIFIVLEERWRVDFHIRRGWPWLEVIENMRGPWFFIRVTPITVALKTSMVIKPIQSSEAYQIIALPKSRHSSSLVSSSQSSTLGFGGKCEGPGFRSSSGGRPSFSNLTETRDGILSR